MLRSKIVAAALAAAMSLSVVPQSFARGGFGGHIGGGHFAGARFGGGGMRPAFVGRQAFAGVRPGFVRPGFVGPRAAFFHHRRFFAPGLAFDAGLALGAYPYYYDDPYYYGYGPATMTRATMTTRR